MWKRQWEVRSVDCEVSSVKCEVWTVKREVWSVKWEECSGKCGVWSAKWSFKWHVKEDTTFAECTHARAWLAHGACKFYRWERSYISLKATSAPPRAGTTGILDLYHTWMDHDGPWWTAISPKELPPEERLERLKALGEPSRRLGRLPEGRTGRPSLGPPQRRRAATVRPGWAAIGGKGMEKSTKGWSCCVDCVIWSQTLRFRSMCENRIFWTDLCRFKMIQI